MDGWITKTFDDLWPRNNFVRIFIDFLKNFEKKIKAPGFLLFSSAFFCSFFLVY